MLYIGKPEVDGNVCVAAAAPLGQLEKLLPLLRLSHGQEVGPLLTNYLSNNNMLELSIEL